MAKRVRDAWGSRIGVVLAAAGGRSVSVISCVSPAWLPAMAAAPS